MGKLRVRVSLAALAAAEEKETGLSEAENAIRESRANRHSILPLHLPLPTPDLPRATVYGLQRALLAAIACSVFPFTPGCITGAVRPLSCPGNGVLSVAVPGR